MYYAPATVKMFMLVSLLFISGKALVDSSSSFRGNIRWFYIFLKKYIEVVALEEVLAFIFMFFFIYIFFRSRYLDFFFFFL